MSIENTQITFAFNGETIMAEVLWVKDVDGTEVGSIVSGPYAGEIVQLA